MGNAYLEKGRMSMPKTEESYSVYPTKEEYAGIEKRRLERDRKNAYNKALDDSSISQEEIDVIDQYDSIPEAPSGIRSQRISYTLPTGEVKEDIAAGGGGVQKRGGIAPPELGERRGYYIDQSGKRVDILPYDSEDFRSRPAETEKTYRDWETDRKSVV